MTDAQRTAIEKHGRKLLVIFPDATERDPVKLCKKLRALENKAHAAASSLCNVPDYQPHFDVIARRTLAAVNKLLGNAHEYQPKTGAACSCKRGQARDNCPTCEGTGKVIDFAAIRRRKPLVPIHVNGDARGYALKIADEYIRAHNLDIHTDMGGYGIIAPEIGKDGN